MSNFQILCALLAALAVGIPLGHMEGWQAGLASVVATFFFMVLFYYKHPTRTVASRAIAVIILYLLLNLAFASMDFPQSYLYAPVICGVGLLFLKKDSVWNGAQPPAKQ